MTDPLGITEPSIRVVFLLRTESETGTEREDAASRFSTDCALPECFNSDLKVGDRFGMNFGL